MLHLKTAFFQFPLNLKNNKQLKQIDLIKMLL